MYYSLIQELMLYKVKLDHNAMKATKEICCTKGQVSVDHSTVTSVFKKYCLGCKKLTNQAKSDRPKIVDFKAVFQTIDTNSASSTWRVSGELSISV